MDLGRYKELKERKLITLQLVGNQVIVISKKYDEATGTELKDSVLPVDVVSLQKQRAILECQLSAITEFLNDVASVMK